MWDVDDLGNLATFNALVERGQIGSNVEFKYAGEFFLSGLPYFSRRPSTLKKRARWLAVRLVSEIENSGGVANTDAGKALEAILVEGGKTVTDLGGVVAEVFAFNEEVEA